MKHRRSSSSSSSSSSPSKKILGTPRPPVRFGRVVKVGDKVISCFGPGYLGLPCKAKIRSIELGEHGKWRYLLDIKEPFAMPFWVDSDVLIKYSKRFELAAFRAAQEDIKRGQDEEIWNCPPEVYCRLMEKYSFLEDATWKKVSLRNRIAAVKKLIRHDAKVAKEKRQEDAISNHGKYAALQKRQAEPQNLTHRDILRRAIAGKKLCLRSYIKAEERAQSLAASRLRHEITLRFDDE